MKIFFKIALNWIFLMSSVCFSMEEKVTYEHARLASVLILGKEPEPGFTDKFIGMRVSDMRTVLLSTPEFHNDALSDRIFCLDYPYARDYKTMDLSKNVKLHQKFKESEKTSAELLEFAFSFDDQFGVIQKSLHVDNPEPRWVNGWIPPLDSISICLFLIKNNPSCYLEIGSGNSTKFARWAIKNFHLQTKIISIDPYPRAEVNGLCDEILRLPLENVADLGIFSNLKAGDVVFFDGSHRAFQNSDVTKFFSEVLPILPSGVVYGIHDICIPLDYPRTWRNRWYNEQYMLTSYLMGGADGDKIIFPCQYVSFCQEKHTSPKVAENFHKLYSGKLSNLTERHGTAFWMQRS